MTYRGFQISVGDDGASITRPEGRVIEMEPEDFERAIELMTRKAIRTAPLISDYFDVRRMEEVYPYIDDNPDKVMKVIVKVSE